MLETGFCTAFCKSSVAPAVGPCGVPVCFCPEAWLFCVEGADEEVSCGRQGTEPQKKISAAVNIPPNRRVIDASFLSSCTAANMRVLVQSLVSWVSAAELGSWLS